VDVFRIHNRRYTPLDGSGAARHGGRWNPVGRFMLYAAAAFEGALLEQLARASVGRIARDRVASRIVIPEDVDVPSLDERDHPEWRREATSRKIGEGWALAASSLALFVPSMVARPWGRNVLINPAHPEFNRVAVAEVVDVVWDPRLS
jgi:RES domain-containing protein